MHACIITYWVCIYTSVQSMYSVCTSLDTTAQHSAVHCCTAVYIKPTSPIRQRKQATTASHTRCHKLGAGCCLDSPPRIRKVAFFSPRAKRQKKQKGGIYGCTIHTYTVVDIQSAAYGVLRSTSYGVCTYYY